VLVTALLVVVCALVVPAVASAETFKVDSTGEEIDEVLGDEFCVTAGGKCTLRAAIEEANDLGESATIEFDESVFDGQVAGSTIVLVNPLPVIVVPITFQGHECPTLADPRHPCVGIDGPAGKTALAVENAEEVNVEGLSVTGAKVGLSAKHAPHLKVQASWFGVKLDDSAGANGTAIVVGPGSNKGLIGGEGPEGGNVIANSSGDGLDIHGAASVRVFGNYFGVEKDGFTPAPNGGKDVEVTSAPGEELEATGTAIGTTVGSGAAATPACDGGCNVISGAGSSGIDLQGDGGEEGPAVETTIAGNYIGLDANGDAGVPNGTSGIEVGQAARTVVGGPKAGAANRINGGGVGLSAGPEAPDLVVRGNRIGVDAAGTGTLAPPGEGIAIDSGELAGAALEAEISDNEIRMEGGVAIAQQGFGARIFENVISGGQTGIRTFGLIEGRGNSIEGNSIAAVEANGILIENNLNDVRGNEVFQSLGSGIKIQGLLPFGASENLIGGDTAANENVISGSGGDAIEIFDLKKTENEVARNRGTGNGGLFIHLLASAPAPEPNVPNNAIEPPAFSTASQTGAAGSAQAGARIRVFRKQSAAAGELESFLGEAVADSEGNWNLTYGGAVAPGTIVAATQTSEAGGTSQLSTATASGAEPPAAIPPPAPSALAAANVVNGDFESGTLSGWSVYRVTGVGNWFAYKGTTPPLAGKREGHVAGPPQVQAPPQGRYAATTDEANPDTLILSQELTLGPGPNFLNLTVYYNSYKPIAIPTPDTLSVDEESLGGQHNQQFRIDVMRAGSPIESLDPADILRTIFQTAPGAPKERKPTKLTADLSALAGQTVRLRIANAADEEVFNAGVDAISITTTPPSPGARFSIGKARANRRNGTVALPVQVPGPGRLAAKGKPPIKPASIGVGAGTTTLHLKPTRPTRKTLKRKHKLRVKVTVTYTPTDGSPQVASVPVVFKLDARSRHRH
jgi:hypothetical protein